MSEFARSRDGRIVGPRGTETRDRLLDALAREIELAGWRRVSVPRLTEDAGTSPATFYQYFEQVEDAVFAVAERGLDGSGVLPSCVAAVVDLLAVEGWRDAKRIQARIAEHDDEAAKVLAGALPGRAGVTSDATA